MRLDKYLKVSRIIKRRTVAKEASEGGRVTINGKVAKPSTEVKEGDVLEIRFGEKLARYRILRVAETVRAETGCEGSEVHSGQNVTKDELEAGETYVSLMRKNLAALEQGLR